MPKKLVEFLQNNFPNTNIDEYLDAKYIQLEDEQLKKIAQALRSGELKIKDAFKCSADNFIFHFGSMLILVKKSSTIGIAYDCELAWETDFQAIYSIRDKVKGFYFIKFNFDDNYNTTLLKTDKREDNQVRNENQENQLINKIMPILKGFISVISE